MSMGMVSTSIARFFADFERGSTTFDGDLLAPQFGATFMTADPHGGVRVATQEAFVAGIAQRRAFFHSLGFQFVKVLSLDETRLDDNYTLVKARVQMRFEREPGKPSDATSDTTYVLYMGDDAPRIVFYLTHDDLLAVLREHGVLPA